MKTVSLSSVKRSFVKATSVLRRNVSCRVELGRELVEPKSSVFDAQELVDQIRRPRQGNTKATLVLHRTHENHVVVAQE